MAIDDNTLYGLTGAQVKELPGKIEAIKGLARVLTTDDYNWPTSSPDGVALWKLPKGLYCTGPGVKKYISTSKSESSSGTILIGFQNDTNVSVTIFGDGVSKGFMRRFSINSATGMEGTSVYSYGLTNRDIIDSLTSTATDKALSANQGKVLKGLIDSLVIKNAGAPTTATVGTVGKLLEDTTNGKLYICTDATNPYVWEEVGTGGGASALTITITPDQQTEGAFTWTGATIAEIQTAFDNGTEVLIGTPGFILKVIARRSTTSAEELTVALDSYNTMALYLYSDGRGESDLFTLVSSKTLAAALATKQNTLTAGAGISITNGVISCTFANGNGVSY